ncbi:MAG TPA: hypothetical protein PKU95_01875 [Candidatus Dojkabacteria bacterium]|nr:hypothetical protein [Candidatus Dojkabacteria bacterium]
MTNLTLGIICGVVFGVLDVLVMIPLPEKDKRKKAEAMISAFIERFMIGFIIPNLDLGIHSAITGLIIGTGLSVPTAIITRIYPPIIGIGVIGGLVIGFITNAVI